MPQLPRVRAKLHDWSRFLGAHFRFLLVVPKKERSKPVSVTGAETSDSAPPTSHQEGENGCPSGGVAAASDTAIETTSQSEEQDGKSM